MKTFSNKPNYSDSLFSDRVENVLMVHEFYDIYNLTYKYYRTFYLAKKNRNTTQHSKI